MHYLPARTAAQPRWAGRLRLYGIVPILEATLKLPRAWRGSRMYPAEERQLRDLVRACLANCSLLDRIQPHVVHVHDPVSLPLSWHLLADGTPPLVATLHGVSPVIQDHPQRKLEQVLRVNLTFMDACIAVDSHTRREAISLGAPSERVTVIHNGVDCDIFTPHPKAVARQRLGLPEGRLLLYCGQLIPRKKVETLLNALPLLLPDLPDLKVAIVGDGPERARLQAKALEMAVSGRVLFAGAQSHKELKWWYRACDAVVIPSTAEGLPIVMLEAMACGRPILAASPEIGIYDPLKDQETGLLFTPATPDRLAEQARRLFLSDGLAAQMGQAARHLMVEEYDWPVIANQFADFYRDVAGGVRANRATQPGPDHTDA